MKNATKTTAGSKRGPKAGRPGVSKRHGAHVRDCRENVEVAHVAAIEEGWAQDYARRVGR